MSFSTWIYVIPGFMQSRGTRTRLIGLWAKLHDEESGRGTTVQLQSWRSTWQDEAEFISRISTINPKIYVVGYSWGAGWGFCQLSRRLMQHGIRIKRAWLLDPVYRHGYTLGQWRAFVPGIPIKIPSNVERVTWWRQNQSQPKGHDLEAESASTIIDKPSLIRVDHVNVDDHQLTLGKIYSQIKMELKCDTQQPSFPR